MIVQLECPFIGDFPASHVWFPEGKLWVSHHRCLAHFASAKVGFGVERAPEHVRAALVENKWPAASWNMLEHPKKNVNNIKLTSLNQLSNILQVMHDDVMDPKNWIPNVESPVIGWPFDSRGIEAARCCPN